MESKASSLKPFHLEDKKSGPKSTIQEATFQKWQQTLEANIRNNDNWARVINQTWNHAQENLGMPGRAGPHAATPQQQRDHVMAMVTYIATYAPNCLFRDITKRCKSVKEIWAKTRDWANLSTTSSGFLTYAQLQQDYDPNGDMTPNDFYFLLRDAAEDCLLVNNGSIKWLGKDNDADEPMAQFEESTVVKDWILAIGNIQLLQQVYRVYSKELETETLADLRRRIADNLSVLQAEAESSALASRMVAQIGWSRTTSNSPASGRGRQAGRGQGARSRGGSGRPGSGRGGNNKKGSGWCKICQENGRNCRHDISQCQYVPKEVRQALVKAVEAEVENDPLTTSESDEEDLDEEEEDFEEQEMKQPSRKSGKSYKSNKHAQNYLLVKPAYIKLCGTVSLYPDPEHQTLNIYDSPILAVTFTESHTIYLILDTGATTSLAKETKVKALGLKIHPTAHRAVQVDGKSTLKVVGEIHTCFTRGATVLTFSALVVSGLATDFLAGTNFLIENDVTINMARQKVTIGDSLTVPTTPNTVLQLEKMSNHNLVSISKHTQVHPGDTITLPLPVNMAGVEEILVEPNHRQTTPFFSPSITQVQNNKVDITNTSNKIINLKKHTQVAIFTTTVHGSHKAPSPISNIVSPQPTLKPLTDVLQEMVIDGSHKLSQQQKQPFIDSISRHLAVFGNDLPGYNHHFGTVYAGFEFASKTKPKSYKLRKPSYGHHAELLYNQKCLQMKQQNVLADPATLDVQPLLLNNAWIVKKASAGTKPWEECSVKDVRLVVGFDFLNKYLQNPPGEVTKPEKIFASVASWKYMAEIDAKDCYFQIPMRTDKKNKKKLAYMCIKTALGTLCFTRAAMGLLGMDVFQDEMMQRIFGDLILQGKLVTLADNIYFGADTLEGLAALLEEVLSRCEAADLRIKPSKVHINLKSADILGHHWSEGRLSPSPHKLEPLAHCERPKTVSALRSFLGGVRFQEICLPGPELASASQSLDAEIPASRSGKELITWTPSLNQSFLEVQKIIKNPLNVTVPRKGDTPYIVSDGCTSLPACGTKLFLKRPGVEGFLPSFHHGCRLPTRLKEYSPCEVEAYSLHQGITKHSFYLKTTQEPGICLVDSKAVYEAKQRMDNGFFSSSRRLQDLLANLSSHRMSVQLISAKLPSPLLLYIDFSSRHPVDCTLSDCRVCLEANKPDLTVMGAVIAEPHIASAAGWREMQRTDGDLRQACSILTTGTKLSAKKKHTGDVKKYLRLCKVNKEGLLVVERQMPFQARPAELIVIPRSYAPNICRIIHNKLDHPVPNQMKKLFNKSYFTLDSDTVLKEVYDTCEVPCQASRILPKETMEYKTETKPLTAGSFLNADVMEEAQQKILVLRDNLTSYTSTTHIKNQTKDTLRDSLLILASRTRLNHNPTQCRVDAHSSLKALAKDGSLEKMGILLDIGHPKNPNHNSPAETAIKELRQELIKINPQGGPASEKTLALATENLNSRIRHLGRSAKELWTSRDQVSGANLTLNDQNISDKQNARRLASHSSSATYASRNAAPVTLPQISPGQAVFVKSDRSKSKARDQYMVLSVDSTNNLATLQKLPMSNFKANPLKVQLQNLYPCRTSPRTPQPSPTSKPLSALPTSNTHHSPPAPIHQPSNTRKPTPTYPRLTPDSSDSEDEDIHWFPTAQTQQEEEPEQQDPEHPEIGENEVGEGTTEDRQSGEDRSEKREGEDIINAESEDEDIINDAVSVHGDEDLEVQNNPEAENPASPQQENPYLIPFTEDLPMHQPKVKKKGELKVGDILLRLSKKTQTWEKVRLSKKYGKIYDNGSYKFEYTDLDGSNPRRNFFPPGAFWSLLNEEEVDLDVATLTTDISVATAQNTSEDEPEVALLHPEKNRESTPEAELLLESPLHHLDLSNNSEELLMGEQPRAPSAAASPPPTPHLGVATLAHGGGPLLTGNDHIATIHRSNSLFLMSGPQLTASEPLQSATSSPQDTPDTSPDSSLQVPPLLDLSPQSPREEPTNTSQTPQPGKTSRWSQIKTFLGSSTRLASTLLGSVSQEQPGAATPFAPAPTPKKGVATLAWVQGPQTTGNKTSAVDQTNHLLLMSELLPLQQQPLTPSVAHIDSQAISFNEETASGNQPSPKPPSQAMAHSPERYASDAESALGPAPHTSDQRQYQATELGSVASEQSRTTPPPACAQIPQTEAAALAHVRRPQSTGNNPLIKIHADHTFRMLAQRQSVDRLDQLLQGDLQADYLDLYRHTTRRRSTSFHGTRSPAAVAVRRQDQPSTPRDRHHVLERHRHWSVCGTDLPIRAFTFPYRLL